MLGKTARHRRAMERGTMRAVSGKPGGNRTSMPSISSETSEGMLTYRQQLRQLKWMAALPELGQVMGKSMRRRRDGGDQERQVRRPHRTSSSRLRWSSALRTRTAKTTRDVGRQHDATRMTRRLTTMTCCHQSTRPRRCWCSPLARVCSQHRRGAVGVQLRARRELRS